MGDYADDATDMAMYNWLFNLDGECSEDGCGECEDARLPSYSRHPPLREQLMDARQQVRKRWKSRTTKKRATRH